MTGAVVTLFVTDAIYGWLLPVHRSGYQPGSGPLEAGWCAFYILLGAAALHPSMRNSRSARTRSDQTLSDRRLVVPRRPRRCSRPRCWRTRPRKGITQNFPVLIGATVVLFILAVVRMWGLVSASRSTSVRERALREAGAALVTATSRELDLRGGARAVRGSPADDARVRICEPTPRRHELTRRDRARRAAP